MQLILHIHSCLSILLLAFEGSAEGIEVFVNFSNSFDEVLEDDTIWKSLVIKVRRVQSWLELSDLGKDSYKVSRFI